MKLREGKKHAGLSLMQGLLLLGMLQHRQRPASSAKQQLIKWQARQTREI
jgi:hypothetical protein